MQNFMTSKRQERFDQTVSCMQHLNKTEEPRGVWLMYQWNSKHEHEYERVANEIIKEYRQGILDPSRVVGKVERKRGSVRQEIESMKRRYAR